MRSAAQIKLEIAATVHELREHEEREVELRKRLGRALIDARAHPELTLEEARQIPERAIPRQTANRFMREAIR